MFSFGHRPSPSPLPFSSLYCLRLISVRFESVCSFLFPSLLTAERCNATSGTCAHIHTSPFGLVFACGNSPNALFYPLMRLLTRIISSPDNTVIVCHFISRFRNIKQSMPVVNVPILEMPSKPSLVR